MKPRLHDFHANVYSQFGEDGIIARILEIIGPGAKICVEFGAWDGFHLSNTANLWARQAWKAVLIEASARRAAQLRRNVAAHDCLCITGRVGIGPDDCLEAILARAGVAPEVDVLSIDIDGNDYYIVESLQTLRPRLIVCEFNPTIPALHDLQPPYGNYFGCSAAALVRVAATKGYRLVATTEANGLFVREIDFPLFAAYETDLAAIKLDTQLVHLMTNFAGEWVLSRTPPYEMNLPYRGDLHGVAIRGSLLAMLRTRAEWLVRSARDAIFKR